MMTTSLSGSSVKLAKFGSTGDALDTKKKLMLQNITTVKNADLIYTKI